MSVRYALPLPTPAEMHAWDQATIKEFGLSQAVLMENAGQGCFQIIVRHLKHLAGLHAFILAGSGNNAGDSFVLARLLANAGVKVLVVHTKPEKHYKEAAAVYFQLAKKTGVTFVLLGTNTLKNILQSTGWANLPEIFADGLLGTGLSGPLRKKTVHLINELNTLSKKAFTLAIDIPSGLHGETGKPQPVAVSANCTVTFQAPKLGLYMPGAQKFCGRIKVWPIGIPPFIMEKRPARHALLCHEILQMLPSPQANMHKGTAGHVVVIGGSPGLGGAPHLTALGSLRAGAGLASIACPEGITTEAKAHCPDIMTIPLGRGVTWEPQLAHSLLPRLKQCKALALGPGIGRSSGAGNFLQELLRHTLPPVVLDADALFALPDISVSLNRHKAVLTPHPGEMAGLLGLTIEEVQENRIQTAIKAAKHYCAVVVLKGATTIIAAPNSTVYISPLCVPNLAVAGSGDVLTGIIASLLARNMNPLQSACLGVYWHGLTGVQLQKKYPLRGNTASDIAHNLPYIQESL